MYVILSILIILFHSFCALGQIHIGGEISGVLRDTTYIVDDYLRVYANDTLVIEPGAELLFAGNYQLQIYGMLIVVGTVTDSIDFLPYDTNPYWGCISFDAGCNDQSILSYCHISGCALGAVNCYGDDITITHCTIENNSGSWGGGIYLNNSHPLISHCLITENSVVSCGGAIYATGSHPLITNCVITNNHCVGQGSGMGGGGICFNHDSDGQLLYSVAAFNSSDGYGGGISIADLSEAQIRNCTIYGNSAVLSGAAVEIYYSAPVITNNVIAQNQNQSAVNFEMADSAALDYNDFYSNANSHFAGIFPDSLGLLSTVNQNGDSCDIYHNIFLEPLFYATAGDSAFYLTQNSPCIDAGDPNSLLDPDSTIADIGVYYFDQLSIPFAVEDLTITVENNNIILDWPAVTSASFYNIYRSDSPYFEITGMTPLASVTNTQYTDINSTLEDKYFYIVTALSE